MKLVSLWCFQLQHIFNCQDTDLPSPHPSPAFKNDLPQRAGEGFSYMPWLILTCHWQVGTREFPAPSEAFNLLREKTIKVLVLLGRREGPTAILQLWHVKFYITKKRSDNSLCGLTLTSTFSSMLQREFILHSSSTNTAWNFYCFFVCLFLLQSHRELPIHLPHSIPQTSSQNALTATLKPLLQWGLKVVCLWPTIMLAKYPWIYAGISSKESNCILFASEPKAVGNCSTLTITTQLKRQSGKGVKGIISPKQTGHMWHISPCNCFCILKGLWRFWCRWFSGG